MTKYSVQKLPIFTITFIKKFFFVLFLIFLLFDSYPISFLPYGGVDGSWAIGLELIRQKNLIFGKDIIFTYGPLGYWIHHHTITTTNFEFFLIDLFTYSNISFLLYHWLPEKMSLFKTSIFFIIFFVIVSIPGEWVHFMLFFTVIFWGFQYLNRQKEWSTPYFIFMGVFNFFVKANFGIIAIIFTISIIFFAYLMKKITAKQFFTHLSLIILLLILMSFLLKTDLVNYTISSLHIVDGYNEVQAFFRDESLIPAIGSFFMLFLIGIAWVWLTLSSIFKKHLIVEDKINIFILFWITLFCYILYKNAFVRADRGHMELFAKFSFLLILLAPTFCNSKIIFKIFSGFFILNFLVYTLAYQPILGSFRFILAKSVSNNLVSKASILYNYSREAFKNDNIPKPKHTFPTEILEIIGNKSVDVVPYEISDIYFNELNYNPRPVFQTYQAYNEYLDNKNREKYLSETAPDFIIYSLKSTDDKYALGDETQTLLAILQRYSVVRSWDDRLLLQKRTSTKTLKLIKTITKTVGFDKPILVTGTNNLLHVIRLQVNYNLLGKTMNFIFQPPKLRIYLSTKTSERSYKTAPKLLSKGIIINDRVDNLEQARQFISSQIVKNQQITNIVVKEVLPNNFPKTITGFSKTIKIIDEYWELSK